MFRNTWITYFYFFCFIYFNYPFHSIVLLIRSSQETEILFCEGKKSKVAHCVFIHTKKKKSFKTYSLTQQTHLSQISEAGQSGHSLWGKWPRFLSIHDLIQTRDLNLVFSHPKLSALTNGLQVIQEWVSLAHSLFHLSLFLSVPLNRNFVLALREKNHQHTWFRLPRTFQIENYWVTLLLSYPKTNLIIAFKLTKRSAWELTL